MAFVRKHNGNGPLKTAGKALTPRKDCRSCLERWGERGSPGVKFCVVSMCAYVCAATRLTAACACHTPSKRGECRGGYKLNGPLLQALCT